MNFLTKLASSYYQRHKEELKRKRQIWYMMNKEKAKRRARAYLKKVKSGRIRPKARLNIGGSYITLGYK